MDSLGTMHACQERNCSKQYDSVDKLKAHLRKVHKVYSKRVVQAENERFCDFTNCGWTGHKSKHALHLRDVHGIVENDSEVPYVLCPCCPRTFSSHRAVVEHYVDAHDTHVVIRKATVSSWSELDKWRETMRSTDCIDFVARRGRSAKSQTFYCSRSGLTAEIIPEQITSSMPRKSVRSGSICIGFATATQLGSGVIEIVYCSNHCGHELSDCWLRLTKAEKLFIIDALKDNRDMDFIIRSIHERTDLPRFSRLKYVNKTDLFYYDRLYNPLYYRLSADDLDSVRTRVESDRTGTFFGFAMPEKENGDGFQVGIMTNEQENQLLQHGWRGIAFDSTHNVTRYMFKLVSAVVYDDKGRSQPVGHFLCFSESERHMIPFFEHLKHTLGDTNPKVLISDDCMAFMNAYNTVFGSDTGTQHIICSWHVVRSWNRRLNCEITDRNTQKIVSTYLGDLIKTNNEQEVRENVAKLLSFLDKSEIGGCANFAKYFRDNYTSHERLKKWAPCYRIGDVANTNMGIERFHRTLKENYLQSKQNKRLDETIECIIRCANDRTLRNIGQERGQTFGSYRVIRNNKNHRMGMIAYASRKELIRACEGGNYVVSSTNQHNKHYTVSYVGECYCAVAARCRACKVCFEQYTCSCPAGTQAGVACKHVHAVHTLFAPRNVPQSESDEQQHNFDASHARRGAPGDVNAAIDGTAELESEKQLTLNLFNNLENAISRKKSELDTLNREQMSDLRSKLSSALSLLQPLQTREIQQGRPKRAPQQRRGMTKRVALTGTRQSPIPEDLFVSENRTCTNCFRTRPASDEPTSNDSWTECSVCDANIHLCCVQDRTCPYCSSIVYI